MRHRNALSPEAQPWVRGIEKDVDTNTTAISTLKTYTANAFKVINAALRKLGEQITELTTAQSELSTAQDDIVDLISTQSTTQTQWDNYQPVGGFTVNTSSTSVSSTTFTVPAGYTKATVIGSGYMFLYRSSGTDTYAYLRTFVKKNGVDINYSQLVTHYIAGSGGSETWYTNIYRDYTGLSGGDSLVIDSRIEADTSFSVTDSSNIVSTQTVVIFSR